MEAWKRDGAAVAAAALVAVAAALVLARGPQPAADVARGSEDAFARGLQRRELPPGAGPQRWTTGRASFTFRDVPPAGVTLSVEVRDARSPVTIVEDGVVVGRLDPGPRAGTFALPVASGGTRRVELWAETFRAGDGRDLGLRLGRVALDWPGRPPFPTGLLIGLLVSAVAACAAARLAGITAGHAGAIAAGVVVYQAALVWPSGVAHSPYATRLSTLAVVGCLLALAFARAVARAHPDAGPAAFLAVLVGWLVQVVAGTSPVMVPSDAVFHANKLAAVAAGDWFPTSVTQHARAFRFPYGVSYYALLAPLARAGMDTLLLVRVGAAVAGLLATAAVFLVALGPLGSAGAAVAALLMSAIPGTFDVAYSYANLSNAFGQDLTVLFFCWWAGRARGGALAGAALLALAALAHFSSLVFVTVLVAALAVAEMRGATPDRARLWAAAVGLLAAAAYYAHFAGLVWSQLPRLLEGGGQGRGASQGAWDAARLQVIGAVGQWGVPATVLAWVGRPRARDGGRYARDLAACWIAGLVLALPAVLSPLEVRYLYGLTAALALSAAAGVLRLEAAGGGRRLAGRALFVLQVVLGGRAVAEALFVRYRP